MSVLYLIPGLVCLLLGAVFLLLYRYLQTKQGTRDRSITVPTWGKLVDTGERTEYNYENRAHTVHYGIYEFDTLDGQHISAASGFGYYGPDRIPGTQGKMVKIFYNPNNPTEFALQEEEELSKTIWPTFRKVGITLTAVGIVVTAVTAAAMLGAFDHLLESLLG